MQEVQARIPTGWLERLRPAIDPTGAAAERLTRVARDGGVVVTTGQQPGLFGGPLYTWSKALTIRALADEMEAVTGIPVAPLFWAANDDSDIAEASWTTVSVPGGFEVLQLEGMASSGLSMSAVPLPDVSALLAALRLACGSGRDGRALATVEHAYRSGGTIGSAYLTLLRDLLEPLGIAVLDASHAAVRSAAHPLLMRALDRTDAVHAALAARAGEIRAAGFALQVAEVADLSLVFDNQGGRRARVARAAAASAAARAQVGTLSPNVLLRPVVERAILPTVAYAAGPGEYAYFAQVSAVAHALEADLPLAVPRWSVTLVEPHVERLLAKYNLTVADVAHRDELSRRLLQQAVPPEVANVVTAMREALGTQARALRRAVAQTGLVPERSVDAIERAVAWRLDRFDRRLRAGTRQRDTHLATDIGSLGGALFPNGVRQERMVNVIPFLVRYGLSLLEQMLAHARQHARALVRPSE
jgi:bacillithiol biosynthesis cysteine-adding enzyme BshC